MSRISAIRQDATAQVLEFATTGRLVGAQPHSINDVDKNATSALTVLTGFAIGVGLYFLILGVGLRSIVHGGLGIGGVCAGLLLLIPTTRLVRTHLPMSAVVVDCGPVLPPELVRAGHWIRRHDAWVRVEETGRDRRGLTALLSTGEVIELNAPPTIAGGAFNPATDTLLRLD